MKILALFIALFLAILPESGSYQCFSQGQEVCCEETVDVEEEAVIRAAARVQMQPELLLAAEPRSVRSDNVKTAAPHTYLLRFERQWLTSRSLRL